MSVGRSRLRLAMVSYSLPSISQRRGGIERAAHTLADGLARRGHELTVFTHDTRPEGARYAVSPLPWRAFVQTWLGRRLTMGYLGNVLAVLPDFSEFDLVVMHGDSVLAPLTGKPVIRVMHGSALGEARSATSIGRTVLQYGVYALELLTALTQDGVVAGSENTRLDNRFIGRVIPYGFDPSTFYPDPAGLSPEPSVLFVGSLDGRKRGRFLLERFIDEVVPCHPTATLTIVGAQGPSHRSVRYLVGVPDAQLGGLYRRSWVYASPSLYEGFGLPYLEAMACGAPVVATPNPGSVEVLGSPSCGVMAADNQFGSALAGLLGDHDRRRELSMAGLERSRQYSLDRMLDSYEQLLFEMIEVRAGSVASV